MKEKRFVVIHDWKATPRVFIASGEMSKQEVADKLEFNRLQREMLAEIWSRSGYFYDCVGNYEIKFVR